MLMGTWPRHIERFEWKKHKAFANDSLFGDDLIDRIHKCVQAFLRSCNKTTIEDVDLGALAEFRGINKKVERGEWLTLNSGWVDRPAQKEEGRRRSDGSGIGARPSGGEVEETRCSIME